MRPKLAVEEGKDSWADLLLFCSLFVSDTDLAPNPK